MAARKKKTAKKVREIKPDVRVTSTGAIEIDLPDNEITQAEAPHRTSYWMGTFPFCPAQNPTMYGFAFARFTGNPTFDTVGRPDRPLDWGIDQEMTDDQVERCVAHVQRHVIRVLGVSNGKVKGPMLSIDSKTYRHEPEKDVPLAAFLYMVESDNATIKLRKACDAPPMTDRKYAAIAAVQKVIPDHREYSERDEPDMDGVEINDAGAIPAGL